MVAKFVAPTASRNYGGDATAEQGRRQQQQLMETVRQKHVQMQLQQRQILEAMFQEQMFQELMQMHQQARQPQGAPPTATAGMEKQFQHQQLNTRGSITSTVQHRGRQEQHSRIAACFFGDCVVTDLDAPAEADERLERGPH